MAFRQPNTHDILGNLHLDVDTLDIPVLGESLIWDGIQWLSANASGQGGNGPFINNLIAGLRAFEYNDYVSANELNTAIARPWGTINGSPAGSQVVATDEPGHPGIVGLTTSTSATGSTRTMLSTKLAAPNTPVILGAGLVRVGFFIKTDPVLSTAAQRYCYRLGLVSTGNAVVGSDPTDEVVLYYDDNINGGRWQLRCRSASGVVQTSDTGITVVADTWYSVEVEINAAGNSAQAFIQHVAFGNPIIVSIPSVALNGSAEIVKSVGVTLRTLFMDFAYYLEAMTIARA